MDINTLTGTIGQPEIGILESRSDAIIERLRERVFDKNKAKQLSIRFNVSNAAKMVGKSAQAIRDAESSDRLPKGQLDENGRRVGYSLDEINRMRDVFGTRPARADTDDPIKLAIQNFKGGVGKSTLVAHLAQFLALKGYRVLILDCDSQATTTTLFGFNPDLDVKQDSTLYPFLGFGGETTLEYAIRKTYWDGIDLVPAMLGLYNAEYEFAARLRGDTSLLDKLRVGIDGVAQNYDVVLLDPPPALGMISLSVLRAANALLIPTPPSTIDFSSTSHFLTMLLDVLEQLEHVGLPRTYQFMKIVATKVNENASKQREIRDMMQTLFGREMLSTEMKASAEIDNATSQLRTIYELESGVSQKTHKRCRTNLDMLFGELELLIRSSWPSHRQKLVEQGVI